MNSADAITRPGTITIVMTALDTRVLVSVTDTGTGMPPDVVTRVIEPFFTTKGENGTGLGLPVVRQIVESYGGRLVIESAVGVGTTVRFDLPIDA